MYKDMDGDLRGSYIKRSFPSLNSISQEKGGI
jgi:hypothetical protein